MKNNMLRVFCWIGLLSLLAAGCQAQPPVPTQTEAPVFDGQQAFTYAQTLMEFGPRTPQSSGMEQTRAYIRSELESFGWQVQMQSFTYRGVPLQNIVAYQDPDQASVLIGAHYDTRLISDQEEDQTKQALPVPGANDGTSGTAVLLEMARTLQGQANGVWLVFFDGEDQGRIDDWEWSVGAQYYADHLSVTPENVIVIDMIGDADLNVYRETQSDTALCDAIWNGAAQLGLQDNFIDQDKYTMLDDHLPFIELGIPTCLLIDFDYPYWHTQQDTLEHISAESLQAVGDVLLQWLSTSSDSGH
ncbi:MAG: glutaminyl-peptide cyclotransferase [Chloroflexota bacterium]|nr:glutaminyl-peptide cyclotransferase [Chloroflexota bacterium]